MKILGAVGLVLFFAYGLAFAGEGTTSRKPAASPQCVSQIMNEAVRYAENHFGGLCSAHRPVFGRERTDSDASQIGAVGVTCHKHVSPISINTSDHELDFSTGAVCGEPFRFGPSDENQ